MFIVIIYLTIQMSISYGLIIYFAQQTIKELKLRNHTLTVRSKQLQRQFSRILLIQVCLGFFAHLIEKDFYVYAGLPGRFSEK
jgi:hypothetical protein